MVRQYHIVLADGTVRHVTASNAEVSGGSLLLMNAAGSVAVTYAPGAWASATFERKKGSSAEVEAVTEDDDSE